MRLDKESGRVTNKDATENIGTVRDVTVRILDHVVADRRAGCSKGSCSCGRCRRRSQAQQRAKVRHRCGHKRNLANARNEKQSCASWYWRINIKRMTLRALECAGVVETGKGESVSDRS